VCGSILEIYFLCCSYCWKYFVVHDVLEKKFEMKGLISFLLLPKFLLFLWGFVGLVAAALTVVFFCLAVWVLFIDLVGDRIYLTGYNELPEYYPYLAGWNFSRTF